MISIYDYLSKHGFEDGDNKSLMEEAEKHHELAAQMIENELREEFIEAEAEAVEVGTTHNPIRIVIYIKHRNKDFMYQGGRLIQFVGHKGQDVSSRHKKIVRTIQQCIDKAASKFYKHLE